MAAAIAEVEVEVHGHMCMGWMIHWSVPNSQTGQSEGLHDAPARGRWWPKAGHCGGLGGFTFVSQLLGLFQLGRYGRQAVYGHRDSSFQLIHSAHLDYGEHVDHENAHGAPLQYAVRGVKEGA